jgi:large subunit ribosomal protein L24
MGLGLKKNDSVIVIAGEEKGKRGRVLSLDDKGDRVLIESVNMIKKHMKPNKQYSQGGIIDKEGPVHMSNVMLLCTKCDKPTRIGNKILENGKKTRECKQCGEVID